MTEPRKCPVALFVYNRPEHTRQTVEALLANRLAADTPLYVFSDAARNQDAQQVVAEVRAYARNIIGFASVTLIEREKNYGLARSIVEGVTQLCDEYGQVIVLEDDLVTAPNFLEYMNQALAKYQDTDRVMQISGYMFPVKLGMRCHGLFLSFPTSWGWATWKRAWDKFDFSAQGYASIRHDPIQLRAFNLDGRYDYRSMLERAMSGQAQSWAVRWHLSVFLSKGLVLYPSETLVRNIGFDGSGVNCVVSSIDQAVLEGGCDSIVLPDEVTLSGHYRQVIDAIPQRKLTFGAAMKFFLSKMDRLLSIKGRNK